MYKEYIHLKNTHLPKSAKKRAKGLNRNFPKEHIHMANRYMKGAQINHQERVDESQDETWTHNC